MAMTLHDKEVVAVGISVAMGCRPCTTYHLKQARGAGAEESVLKTAVAAAVCVRASATEGMRRHALGLEAPAESCGGATPDLLSELASLGASLAVNCTSTIAKHLAAARQQGATEEQLEEVLTHVRKIRAMAVAHAERQLGGPAPEGRCVAMACC